MAMIEDRIMIMRNEFKINGVRFSRTPRVNGWIGVRMFSVRFNGWIIIGKVRTADKVCEFAEHYMEKKIKEIARN